MRKNLILRLGWKRMKIIRGSYYRPPVYIMRIMRWNGSPLSRNPLIAYEKVEQRLAKRTRFKILAEEVLCRCGLYNCYYWAINLIFP